MRIYLCLLSFSVLLNISCNSKHAGKTEDAEKDTYVNPLFTEGPNPNAIYHDGKYYYTHETNDQIFLWVTTDITDMPAPPVRKFGYPKILQTLIISGILKSEISMANGISILRLMTGIRIITKFM